MTEVAQSTMWLKADGVHRDVRGWAFTGTPDIPQPFGLSQSEILATLRGEMHLYRPYTLAQLIVDLDALIPARLDTDALRMGKRP